MKGFRDIFVRALALLPALWLVFAVYALYPSNLAFAGGEAIGCKADVDCDGLLDADEDMDGDGEFEPEQGETDPQNPDTDGDGLIDGDERLHKGKVALLLENRSITVKFPSEMSPLKTDSDGDCLPDGVEAGVSADELEAILNSIRQKPKYDISAKCQAILDVNLITALEGALYRDAEPPSLRNIAALYDTDPLTVTDPTSADTDGDGVTDGGEDVNFNGKRDRLEAGDDSTQGFWKELSPVLSDSDGDGILDGDEGDRDGDGKFGPDESDPMQPDTDHDGVLDGDELRAGTHVNVCDSDSDGLSDGIEMGKIQPDEVDGCRGLQASGTNYKRPTEMSALNPDSDGDGLMDGEEDQNRNGWLDSDESDPTVEDTDNDRLSDGLEALGDFDGDGIPDFDFTKIQAGGSCSPPAEISDIDCDGVANSRDDDSDNDGCPDKLEGEWVDTNTNGIPDVYDFQSKTCPDEAAPLTGGGGGGGYGSPSGGNGATTAPVVGGGGGAFSNMADDGGACTLISGKTGASGGSSSLVLYLLLLISMFILRFQTRSRRAV